MTAQLDRRQFVISSSAALAMGGLLSQPGWGDGDEPALPFRISVAEYSLHRMLRGGKLDPRDFGPFCREKFDVDAVEYWMGPYADKASDAKYMGEMKKRSDDAGVKSLLIMVDLPDGQAGSLGHPDGTTRTKAIENHYPWVHAARAMGCHSIRVNARSDASLSRDEQAKLAADGLGRLAEFAADHDMNVLVENHGGLSSDGKWLADVMRRVGRDNCGTLPDFGNFRISDRQTYDRYQGVAELMPFAKAVSAKSIRFGPDGQELDTDYRRMMEIVLAAGYRGYVGIEWEGAQPESEVEGVLLTKRLLERVREQLS